MPLQDSPLVVEPTYPRAEELMAIDRKPESPFPYKERNVFYSHKLRCDVHVLEDAEGAIVAHVEPRIHSLSQQLQTLGNSDAWGIEQEHNALQTLAGLVTHRQMKQYLLTGAFLETSMRSGKGYMFRKLRPTVVLHEVRGEMRILCALCLHPIAYYAGSWAGAMCPTDDVIAHLMLMRGDEHMFWRRANQHAAYRPEAGL